MAHNGPPPQGPGGNQGWPPPQPPRPPHQGQVPPGNYPPQGGYPPPGGQPPPGYGPPGGQPPAGNYPPSGGQPPPGRPPPPTGPRGADWGEELPGPRSPLLAALLNIFCCFPFGHVYIGQTKKALFFFLISFLAAATAFGLPILWIVYVIDAYQLAERQNRQGSIRAMENGIDFLDQLFGPQGVIKP